MCLTHGMEACTCQSEQLHTDDFCIDLRQCDMSRYFARSHSATAGGKYTAALSADLDTHADSSAMPLAKGYSDNNLVAAHHHEHEHHHHQDVHRLHSMRSRGGKHVVFADQAGMQLTAVRFIKRSTSLGQGLNYQEEVLTKAESEAYSSKTLTCTFSQPVSDYVAFAQRLLQNNVCLHSVEVSDDWTVSGQIVVRNLSFEKHVFVRASFNNWLTFVDFPATYAKSIGECDVFAFSFQCPKDLTTSIELCVCFESGGAKYWDNNNASNYKICILHSRRPSYTHNFKPNFAHIVFFTDFSAWEHYGDNVYY